MKRINCILIFLLLLLGNGLYAQTDSIISVSGEVGDFDSGLDFLNEAGDITRFPRLTDAGELLYYAPMVSTDSVPVALVGASTATVYGNILFNGWCESVLEQGFQISTTSDFLTATTFQVVPVNPYTDCDPPCSENVFSYSFTGLTPSTTYYVRAYATNSEGIGYGNIVNFKTVFANCGTVTDYDGNVYQTLRIGSQCWMRENLRTTHYANGVGINLSTTAPTDSDHSKKRFYPNNSAGNVSTYGYLYNGYAVLNNASASNSNPSGVQGICPNGWHVPSRAEWIQLTNYVGEQSQYCCSNNSSYIAKSLASNSGWLSRANTCEVGYCGGATNNATGFSAMPAGYCKSGSSAGWAGFGISLNQMMGIWSASNLNNSGNLYAFRLSPLSTSVNINDQPPTYGYSVRCVKN